MQATLWMETFWIYIQNVKSGNHNVDNIIHNVAQNKNEKILNIVSDIMNGDIVDAPCLFSLFSAETYFCLFNSLWGLAIYGHHMA